MSDVNKMKKGRRCEQVKKAKSTMQTKLRIERRQDGRLWTVHDGKEVALRVQPCFPWSYPEQYISLRDDDDNEIALINDLDDLQSRSRQLVKQALSESAFVMEIEAVLSRKEEFEVRTWDVQTKQGRRKFQTKRDAWPQALPGGGLLIRDVAGDLFYIPDLDAMDPTSRKFLAPFID